MQLVGDIVCVYTAPYLSFQQHNGSVFLCAIRTHKDLVGCCMGKTFPAICMEVVGSSVGITGNLRSSVPVAPRKSESRPLWYLLTSCFLLHQLFEL